LRTLRETFRTFPFADAEWVKRDKLNVVDIENSPCA
jgi:hypothetical protein